MDNLFLYIPLSFLLGALIMYVYQLRAKQAQDLGFAELNQRIQQMELKKKELEQELAQAREQLKFQQNSLIQLHSEKAKAEVNIQHLQQKIKENAEDETQLRLHFQEIARSSLDQNAERLSKQQEEQLENLLSPLREKLQQFEQRVESSYKEEARERFHLKKEIESLITLNQQLGIEAQNLSKALKGDSKIQGNWGEMVLSRVLEASGLREGAEFTVQARDFVLWDEEGNRFQPDVIINLPDDKHLIVDSKVSLTAYERHHNAELESERYIQLRKHVESVQTHIRQLGAKHYEALPRLNSPEFVILFMPLESAFSLVLQAQPDLFQLALDNKIVLASPSTLLATLRTVASVWKLEKQNQHATEIARQGGLLYDKLAVFVEDLEKIGKSLSTAQDIYDKSFRRLYTGKGNLLSRAEKLKDLGVNSQRNIPFEAEDMDG